MIEVGRLAIKTAGRDAGKHSVIVDILDDNYVLIDGATRRKKCNSKHLLLLDQKIDISKKAKHEDIESAFKKLKIDVLNTKAKKTAERPRRKRKTPEQLRTQKEEKKKIRDVFKKKQEQKDTKSDSLEEKTEDKKEAKEVKKETPKKDN
tara:strand:- start:3874 stop:4320 length:447 start_codon:yes stop_codon:yes gene_type:complete